MVRIIKYVKKKRKEKKKIKAQRTKKKKNNNNKLFTNIQQLVLYQVLMPGNYTYQTMETKGF